MQLSIFSNWQVKFWLSEKVGFSPEFMVLDQYFIDFHPYLHHWNWQWLADHPPSLCSPAKNLTGSPLASTLRTQLNRRCISMHFHAFSRNLLLGYPTQNVILFCVPPNGHYTWCCTPVDCMGCPIFRHISGVGHWSGRFVQLRAISKGGRSLFSHKLTIFMHQLILDA